MSEILSRILIMFRVFFDYLKLVFFPISLYADYGFPSKVTFFEPLTLFSISIILLLVGIALFYCRHRNSLFIFSFLIMLLPVSNLIPLVNLMAERYLYLPLINFAILGGIVLNNWYRKNKKVTTIFIIFLLTFYFVRIHLRNQDWQDDLTFFFRIVKQKPQNFRAKYNLALAYQKRSSYKEAIEHYQKALTLKWGRPDIHNNLGICLEKEGRLKEAEKQYLLALKFDPESVHAHNNLGNVYRKMRKLYKATEEYLKAIGIQPNYAPAWNNLGIIYAQRGALNSAISYFKKALQINPDYKDALFNFETVQKQLKSK